MSSADPRVPLVSIGLLVYNGIRYVAEALDSLLAQTFEDVEIIVSDNASTDGTAELLREYAGRFERIRLFEQPRNIGAINNFNFVANQARGKYFMWAAFDDRWAPTFVEKCVAVMERYPGLSVCGTWVQCIDENGEPFRVDPNLEIHGPGTLNLLRALMPRYTWFGMYGLLRTEALRRTHLFRDFWGSEVYLVFELALQGDFYIVPEPLWSYRVIIKTPEYILETLPPEGEQLKQVYTYTHLVGELLRLLWRAPRPLNERLALVSTFVTMGFFSAGQASTWRYPLFEEAKQQLRAALIRREVTALPSIVARLALFYPVRTLPIPAPLRALRGG